MMFSDGGRRPAANLGGPADLFRTVEAVRRGATHMGKPIARTRAKARALFIPRAGQRGGFALHLEILGSVGSLGLTAASNGGAHRHGRLGWWPSEAAALAALDAALDAAYADEVAAASAAAAAEAESAARWQAGAAQREEEARRREAAQAALDNWDAQASQLVEEVARKGGSLSWRHWEAQALLWLPEKGVRAFDRTPEGLEALRAFLRGEEPVVVPAPPAPTPAPLVQEEALMGLFGGAAQIKKGRR